MTESIDVMLQKCPNCGDTLNFDPKSQMMVCQSCDSVFDPEEIGDDSGLIMDKRPWDDNDTAMYHCPSCGGDLIFNKNSVSTNCPYCGNNTIIGERLSGLMRPNRIIPFTVEKEKAERYVISFLRNSGLGKGLLQRTGIISTDGVYMPFWTYSSRIYGNVQFINIPTGIKDQPDCDLYTCVSAIYQHVPVDGSLQLPNEISESLEPYDFKKSVPFDSSYLSGFAADKYDVSAADCFKRAKQRMSNDLLYNTSKNMVPKQKVEKTVNTVASYVSKAPTTVVQYVLCPIWLVKVSINGRKQTFYVNGQTGKVSGHVSYMGDSFRKRSTALFVLSQIIPLLILILTSGILRISLLIIAEALIIASFFIWHKRNRVNTDRQMVQYGAYQYMKWRSMRVLYKHKK